MNTNTAPSSEYARELVERAYAIRRAGDRATSRELYRQAATAFGDDLSGRAHCLRHIGDLERELGRSTQAREALREAESLYRTSVNDVLSLANAVRLLALLDGDRAMWRDARTLYEKAGIERGLDLGAAFAECDKHLAADPG